MFGQCLFVISEVVVFVYLLCFVLFCFVVFCEGDGVRGPLKQKPCS